MLLKELLQGVEVLQTIGDASQEVGNITQSSRDITPNTLFFAIKGAHTDGHRFIPEVIAQQGKVLVVEDLPEALAEGVTYVQVTDTSRAMGQIAAHFYGHPSEQLRLVGVTGTNGKTTIASLSYQLFRQLGYKVGLISTIAIYIDQEREETHNTTPDVLTLNKVLRRMVDQGVTH